MNSSTGSITTLLRRAAGEPAVQEELYGCIQCELRKIAAKHLRGQGPGYLLEATQLVDMAFAVLVEQGEAKWEDRRHFFRAANRVMWHEVVDLARRKRPELGSPELLAAHVDAASIAVSRRLEDEELLSVVHHALLEFEQLEPQAAEVFRMRCFLHWQFEFAQSTPRFLEGSEPLEKLRTFRTVGDILGISHTQAQRLFVLATDFLKERVGRALGEMI